MAYVLYGHFLVFKKTKRKKGKKEKRKMKKLFLVILLVMSVVLPALTQTTIVDEASYTVADLYNQYKWFWDSLWYAVPIFTGLLFAIWYVLCFLFTPKFLERQNREDFPKDKHIYHGRHII